jgi:hypothetical protein
MILLTDKRHRVYQKKYAVLFFQLSKKSNMKNMGLEKLKERISSLGK